MRLRVIERAQVQGNVSAVCRELGISWTVFYRWRQRLERYGVDGVHPRRQRARAGRPVATAPEVERLVLGLAISAATWGCRRIAAYLARAWRVRLAPSTVQRLLRRVGLATRRARLTVLELSFTTLGRRKCQHRSEPGQTSLLEIAIEDHAFQFDAQARRNTGFSVRGVTGT